MLAARNLSKRYGATCALTALHLEIAAGEVFCLLGPNGAGKTTTLALWLGFIEPSSGAAYVGTTHVQADPLAARAQLAYVPEQVRLYPHLSGLENLEYFLRLAGKRVRDRAELEGYLLAAGVQRDALARRCSGYSKGMRQKVVLALAQARQASALLLDEPTSGLDPGAADELYDAVKRESERGAAVLMVTHDLTAVCTVAQRFGIILQGTLVHVDSAAGLDESDVQALYREHLKRPALQPEAAREIEPEGQPVEQ